MCRYIGWGNVYLLPGEPSTLGTALHFVDCMARNSYPRSIFITAASLVASYGMGWEWDVLGMIGWNGVKGAKLGNFSRASSGTAYPNALERQVHHNWVCSILEESAIREKRSCLLFGVEELLVLHLGGLESILEGVGVYTHG